MSAPDLPDGPVTLVRWWHVDGLAATLMAYPDTNDPEPLLLVDGETEPCRLPVDGWTLAPPCEYCTKPAEVYLIDSGGETPDLLCRVCARDHFDRPADWVRPIGKRLIRRAYPVFAGQGMRRLYESLFQAA